MIALYPSLMAADLLNLKNAITTLEPYCAGFHVDIMDNTFVPNVTWGPDTVNALRNASKKTLWLDLLVDHPSFYLNKIKLNKNDIVTLHYESRSLLHDKEEFLKISDTLHKNGLKLGLAINPKTPIKVLSGYIDQIDYAILMSVEPGFSGNPFSRATLTRLEELQTLLKPYKKTIPIGLDGGINEETFLKIKPLGVQLVAIGSGIFNRPDALKALKWYSQ